MESKFLLLKILQFSSDYCMNFWAHQHFPDNVTARNLQPEKIDNSLKYRYPISNQIAGASCLWKNKFHIYIELIFWLSFLRISDGKRSFTFWTTFQCKTGLFLQKYVLSSKYWKNQSKNKCYIYIQNVFFHKEDAPATQFEIG